MQTAAFKNAVVVPCKGRATRSSRHVVMASNNAEK